MDHLDVLILFHTVVFTILEDLQNKKATLQQNVRDKELDNNETFFQFKNILEIYYVSIPLLGKIHETIKNLNDNEDFHFNQ